MPLDVDVAEPVPIGPDRSDLAHEVTIRDDDYPGVEATFLLGGFVYGSRWALLGVSVWPIDVDDLSATPVLSISALRRFPLSRWEREAKAATTAWWIANRPEPPENLDQMLDDLSADWGAVFAKRPDLNRRDLTPGQRRALNAAQRHARVARLYRQFAADTDVRDPAKAVARELGVKPATARSWIHRARMAEFLDPAELPSRTDNEGETK